MLARLVLAFSIAHYIVFYTKGDLMTKQKAVAVPFGPTSEKQQMIMDCEAQILIMGGGV